MKRTERWPRKAWFDKASRGTIGVLFIELLAVLVYSYLLSRPDIEIPGDNRQNFARIAILMDGTRSLHAETFPLIKRVVRTKILPNLGMNDIALAYDVRPDFATAQNAVFGVLGDQLPQDSESRRVQILDVLDRDREQKKPDGDLYDLIRSLPSYQTRVLGVLSGWAQRVEKRKEPERDGSDICSPLRDLGGFLRSGDSQAEKWLVVLSDLKNSGPSQSCRPEDPFPNSRILLIYPLDSDSPSWTTVEGFWQGFFGGRKLERVPLSAALADEALIDPNPTAGLERYVVPTMWESARPWIVPALLLAIGAFATISAVTAFAPYRNEPVKNEGAAAEGEPTSE